MSWIQAGVLRSKYSECPFLFRALQNVLFIAVPQVQPWILKPPLLCKQLQDCPTLCSLRKDDYKETRIFWSRLEHDSHCIAFPLPNISPNQAAKRFTNRPHRAFYSGTIYEVLKRPDAINWLTDRPKIPESSCKYVHPTQLSLLLTNECLSVAI